MLIGSTRTPRMRPDIGWLSLRFVCLKSAIEKRAQIMSMQNGNCRPNADCSHEATHCVVVVVVVVSELPIKLVHLTFALLGCFFGRRPGGGHNQKILSRLWSRPLNWPPRWPPTGCQLASVQLRDCNSLLIQSVSLEAFPAPAYDLSLDQTLADRY